MGGVNQSKNFLLNCSAWDEFYNNSSKEVKEQIDKIKVFPENIGIAPVTGANQNIGFKNEEDFYLPYFAAAYELNFNICVGDGAPDEKLKFGNDAVSKLKTKAYYFFKPYPDEVLRKRVDLCAENAVAIGMDIDAYNIVTMRNQAHLEKKNENQIKALEEYSGLPVILKGVFSEEDIGLCKKVHPHASIISNHGGRVEVSEGSTFDFLKSNGEILHQYCKEVWVDGGIRTKRHIQVAMYLGADKVLIARGFISKLIKTGVAGAIQYGKTLFS